MGFRDTIHASWQEDKSAVASHDSFPLILVRSPLSQVLASFGELPFLCHQGRILVYLGIAIYVCGVLSLLLYGVVVEETEMPIVVTHRGAFCAFTGVVRDMLFAQTLLVGRWAQR